MWLRVDWSLYKNMGALGLSSKYFINRMNREKYWGALHTYLLKGIYYYSIKGALLL